MDAPATDEGALRAAADEVLRLAATMSHEDGLAYLASVAEDRPLVFAQVLMRMPEEAAAALGLSRPTATSH